MDGCLSGPRTIFMKLHVNRGHAPAQQLRRALVESAGNNTHLLTCVDAEPAQSGVCQAFEKGPHFPAAGTSTVAVFNEKLQVGRLLFDDIIALHLTVVFSKYSQLTPFA